MVLFCCSFTLLFDDIYKGKQAACKVWKQGKGYEDKANGGVDRRLGWPGSLDGSPRIPLLLKGPWTPQPHSPAMVMPEAEENSQLSSHRRGKLVMGFSEKVPPYARTLSLPCARISHSTGQKKCKILEWACIITLILLRVSPSQAEVIHSLFWSCSSPL